MGVAVTAGLTTALTTRTYAGASLGWSPIGRLRARLNRSSRRQPTVVRVLLAWCMLLVAGGWIVGLAVEWSTGGGSVGLVGWFAARRVGWLTDAMQIATRLGGSPVAVPVAAAVGLVWRWRRGSWWAFRLLAVAYLGSSLIYNAVKWLVGASRPVGDVVLGLATGPAFPSGHTANATVVYGGALIVALATHRGRRLQAGLVALCGALVATIALSRVYLGVHWLLDVVGGALLGGLWLAAVVATIDQPAASSSTNARSRSSAAGPD